MQVISDWFRRYFADPQAVFLAVLLIIGFGVILTMGRMLAPVFASIVLAYLLEGVVRFMERQGAPRFRVVILVFMVFMAFVVFLIFGVTPLLWAQTLDLVRELPSYISQGQQALMRLPEHYPFIKEEQVTEFMLLVRSELAERGQRIVSMSLLASILDLISLLVYLILVPVLVFFFLKDKDRIVRWFTGFLPEKRALTNRVWHEVDQQIGNYVRGKFWEILIVGAVSFVLFALMGLKYAMLLAALVGLSVLVPYIGAAVVTIPVAVIAYFQWGWGPQFGWLMVAYGILQALDGYVLVPLLFSEVVNLHPVAIIVAILVFGGLWGFWGVFFAIPLATLVSAIISAWPRPEPEDLGPLCEDVPNGG